MKENMDQINVSITKYTGGFVVHTDADSVVTTSLQKAMAIVKSAFVEVKEVKEVQKVPE